MQEDNRDDGERYISTANLSDDKMGIRLFNTLSREKEIFTPITKGKVMMYSCGPTVYNYAHIGNFRSFIFADVLKRYLRYRGFEVVHVMNITDVDDKTIRDSKKEGKSLKDFTEFYTEEFFKDFETLGIEMPDIIPKATETVEGMIVMIQGLLDKGFAYKSKDGSIYFDISKFKEYGKLSHIDISGLKAGARVKYDEYEKANVSDFALWKAWAGDDGNVFWDAPFGKGRPGWHIECSVMSTEALGSTFDIHTGGVDLIFPHHENEIAQSEAATGKPFVNYWAHCEHLLVDGKKMSKSLGNFYTLRDLLKKCSKPIAIRYILLSTHYRQKLNFTFEALESAEHSVERLNNFVRALQAVSGNAENKDMQGLLGTTKQRFAESMDNDLNISEALASLFDLVRDVNKMISEKGISKKDADSVLEAVKGFDSVLGVLDTSEDMLDDQIQGLIDKRESARKNKDFAEADRIRDKLKEKGIVLEDTKEGIRWKRA